MGQQSLDGDAVYTSQVCSPTDQSTALLGDIGRAKILHMTAKILHIVQPEAVRISVSGEGPVYFLVLELYLFCEPVSALLLKDSLGQPNSISVWEKSYLSWLHSIEELPLFNCRLGRLGLFLLFPYISGSQHFKLCDPPFFFTIPHSAATPTHTAIEE
ncbi:hypothetical protein BgiMline_029023 [Biomphalaria glabrata]|nr:hypothetical protein BgiMline_025656 [Biomphalaria glabrata]